MRIFDSVERLVEWFTPAEIAADIHARKRVRMFLWRGGFRVAALWPQG